MSDTELQTALLLIQDLALLVTIIGWIYTSGQQRDLLRETRQYQRMDRDLSVYRTRMERASQLTASLIMSSDWWFKLASLAKATIDDHRPQEFFRHSEQLTAEGFKTKPQLALILYDPQFRTLRDLLPEAIGKKIYDSLKASSLRIQAFHEKTYSMEPSSPTLIQQLTFVHEEGKEIGDALVTAADLFADAFAYLDRQLTKQQ
ncbi:MAG TPA: hypothetical protein VI729_03130 [Anaerolineales bacterium]|nr:hypothetical protein [Anaerolineales bacterium]